MKTESKILGTCFHRTGLCPIGNAARRPPMVLLASLLAGLLSNSSSFSQEVKIGLEQGPYYVGEPVLFQVAVIGADGSQDITCRYAGELTPDLSVAGPEVGKSTQSIYQNFNGSVVQRESADYRFNFQVTSTKEGNLEIGPFIVSIDGSEQNVSGTSIRLEKLAPDPEMKLEVEIERENIYVGERIPITFRWSFFGDRDELEEVYGRLQIRSPLFDQFEFSDTRTRGTNALVMTSAGGSVKVGATAKTETIDGKPGVVVSSTRMMLVESPGNYENIVTSCRTDRVNGWRRGFLGGVTPSSFRPAIALSKPLSFTVKELPREGRPANFSGAVGNGFSIEVAVNRSVVRVGDPISLDVSISGDGNLEKLSIPPMTGPEGLDPKLFQLPGEDPSGTFSNNRKQFKITLRIKDEGVTQIPALPFSWFDPIVEEYHTSYSKPIALQVMETQMITADDVVSTTPRDEIAGAAKQASSPLSSSLANPANSLLGANLAIEKNSMKLLAASSGFLANRWTLFGCYGLGVFSLALAFLVRRKRSEDPTLSAKKQALKSQRRRIQDARTLPSKQAAEQIAAALRVLLSSVHTQDRTKADSLIADCETMVYAPVASHDAAAIAALVERGLDTFDQLAKEA